jgi:hypothetical protein
MSETNDPFDLDHLRVDDAPAKATPKRRGALFDRDIQERIAKAVEKLASIDAT